MAPIRRSRRVLGNNPDNAGLAAPKRSDRTWSYTGVLPESLVTMYRDFNKKFFDGSLVGYTIHWGNKNMKATYGDTDPVQRIVTISPVLHDNLMTSLGKEKGMQELESSVLHEMCHVKVFLDGHRKDSISHGPRFQEEAARVSCLSKRKISIDHPNKEDEVIKKLRRYTYRCKCGHEVCFFTKRMPDGLNYGYHNCPREPEFNLVEEDKQAPPIETSNT